MAFALPCTETYRSSRFLPTQPLEGTSPSPVTARPSAFFIRTGKAGSWPWATQREVQHADRRRRRPGVGRLKCSRRRSKRWLAPRGPWPPGRACAVPRQSIRDHQTVSAPPRPRATRPRKKLVQAAPSLPVNTSTPAILRRPRALTAVAMVVAMLVVLPLSCVLMYSASTHR